MTVLRKSKRFNSSIPAYFYAYGKKRPGVITNFSQSGIFLNSETLLKKNTDVTVFFKHNGYLHKTHYKVVRSQSEINLKSDKSYLRGMGLELNDHKNPFPIFANCADIFSSQDKISNAQSDQASHIIIFDHIFDFINLYHAQITNLNFTFLNKQKIPEKTTINIIIRTKDQNFNCNFNVLVKKHVKDIHSKNYFIYCEVNQNTHQHLQSLVDQTLSQLNLNKNLPIANKGTLIQHPLLKIILISIEMKYSGMLNLTNFNNQTLASFYFKDGSLLHVQTNSKQRLLKIILNSNSISDKSKQIILKQNLNLETPIDLRDFLIRKNIISAELMFNIWKQYLLKNFHHLANMFNLNYYFIKKLPKEMIALNETLEIKNNIFAILNGYDDMFLKHFSHFSTEKYFSIHKQKLYLWPRIILNLHHLVDEQTIYNQDKLAKTLSISQKESRAFICYLSFINELIVID
ncbi:MAG TPA: PilZ domain-containing protein [Oligoflexia bacterium]|nr:PilZ domain-containing protein [Oligoflexia bacterium]HMR24736.1 PilZ domain-containing protein [Oligoflexia bacterium]